MKNKFGIKEVVATGIGTALFIVLTNVQIPLGIIPNTSLQPRAALLAFFAAAFVANIIAVGVLGTILTAAYSKIGAKSSSLTKED